MIPYRNLTRKTYYAEWCTFDTNKVNVPCPLREAKRIIKLYLPKWAVTDSAKPREGLCYTFQRTIAIGRAAPTWIVCHEIAHGLVEEDGLPRGHHEVFRERYVGVVEDILGAKWANKLRSNFDYQRLVTCDEGEQDLSPLYRLFKRTLDKQFT